MAPNLTFKFADAEQDVALCSFGTVDSISGGVRNPAPRSRRVAARSNGDTRSLPNQLDDEYLHPRRA